MNALMNEGLLTRSMKGQLVPICCYIVMAVSLNLTVGILGELSLGHAGFMSVGAFTGDRHRDEPAGRDPNATACALRSRWSRRDIAGIVGFLIGIPCCAAGRLSGHRDAGLRRDHQGAYKLPHHRHDENGLHIIFNATGKKTVNDLGLSETGKALIKGAQGATGTDTIASFTAGFILIMVTLIVVLKLLARSAPGRAIMALRDNRIPPPLWDEV